MYQYIPDIYVCHPKRHLPMSMYFWHPTRKTTIDNVLIYTWYNVCHPIHHLPHMCMYFWHSTRKTTLDNVPIYTRYIYLPPYTPFAEYVDVFPTPYQKDHTRQCTNTYPICICLPPYTPFATYVYVFLSPFILPTPYQKVAPVFARYICLPPYTSCTTYVLQIPTSDVGCATSQLRLYFRHPTRKLHVYLHVTCLPPYAPCPTYVVRTPDKL